MKRYKFAPMLGPAHGKPVGSSSQRAECWGNELECHVESCERPVDDWPR